MLNEKRVKHMIKLAAYEEKAGKEEFKIYSYTKKDYVSFSVWASLIWITVAYVALAAIVFMASMEMFMEKMTIPSLVMCVAIAIIGYFIVLILCGWYSNCYYKRKHSIAKQNVKRFIRNLETLEKMYEREDV